MMDGHLNKCKECNKADTIKNRDKKLDYYREYDKGRRSNPNRIVAHNACNSRWRENNAHKVKCHSVVENKLSKHRSPVCEMCGKETKTHGHHDDYTKPLQVKWVCPQCHHGALHCERRGDATHRL
jgi:hypothetical protein